MRPDTVLVLTQWLDPTADLVIEHLNERRLRVFRCDPGDFPQRLSLTGRLEGAYWTGRLVTPHQELRIERVRSIYYGRPTRYRLPAGMSEPEHRWSAAEARLGVGGVLLSLPGRWVNHPSRAADAAYKPWQLQVAAQCGLRVPATLVTNDPEEARAFAETHGRVVYKALSNTQVAEHGHEAAIVYTTPVTADQLDDPAIRRTAHQFQEWVDKAFEVRATVVGDRVFPAAIRTDSPAGRIDWRADYPANRYEVTEVPHHVMSAIRRLMLRLGLEYAALDFAVTPAGEWVFFEANPAGAWGWIEEATGMSIARALADLLEEGLPA